MRTMCATPHEHARFATASAQALQRVWDRQGCRPSASEQREHVERVCSILRANLCSGRWRRASTEDCQVLDELTDDCLHDYCARIAENYWSEIARQTAQRDPWQELYDQLEQHARSILYQRMGFAFAAACQQACDYAQEACQLILKGSYPYDVPYSAWTGRILINCILGKLGRSTDLLDRVHFVEQDLTDMVESIGRRRASSPHSHDFAEGVDRRLVLLGAIRKLPSEDQRLVIIRGFFYGWNATQIAEELGKTPQAVHNLKHRALLNLREILVSAEVTVAPGVAVA